jgi:hypothetical protein
MSPTYKIVVIMLAAGLFLAGCAGSSTDQPKQSDDNSTPGLFETESGPTSAIPSETEVDETPDGSEQRHQQTLAPVSGEVPEEIMDQIIADLVERTGADREVIQVIRSEARVWNDGSLGCPKPGEFYIQMLINGYWVVLKVEGTSYDYRVSDKGYFTLCEGRGELPISPPVDPGSGTAPNQ